MTTTTRVSDITKDAWVLLADGFTNVSVNLDLQFVVVPDVLVRVDSSLPAPATLDGSRLSRHDHTLVLTGLAASDKVYARSTDVTTNVLVTSSGAAGGAAAPIQVVGPLSQAVTGTLTRHTNLTQYTAGDVIAPVAGNKYITLPVSRAVDVPVWIKRLRLKVNDSAWKGATVRVHLFKDAPTVTPVDNAALNASETYAFSESNYLGYVEITLTQQTNDATAFVKGFVAADIVAEPSAGTVNIFAVLECRSTPTPAASKIFTLTAECVRD